MRRFVGTLEVGHVPYACSPSSPPASRRLLLTPAAPVTRQSTGPMRTAARGRRGGGRRGPPVRNGFGQLGDGSTTARPTLGAVAGAHRRGRHPRRPRARRRAARRRHGVDVGQQRRGPARARHHRQPAVCPSQVPSSPVRRPRSRPATTTRWRCCATARSGLGASNSDGQLGDGTTHACDVRRSRSSGFTDAVAIAGGRDMAYADPRERHGASAGDATTRASWETARGPGALTPVRVGTLTGVEAIAGGRDHGLAVRVRRVGVGLGFQRLRADRRRDHHRPADARSRSPPARRRDRRRTPLLRAAQRRPGRRPGAATTAPTWATGPPPTRTRPVDSCCNVTDAVSIGSGRDFGLVVAGQRPCDAPGATTPFGQLGDGTITNRTQHRARARRHQRGEGSGRWRRVRRHPRVTDFGPRCAAPGPASGPRRPRPAASVPFTP